MKKPVRNQDEVKKKLVNLVADQLNVTPDKVTCDALLIDLGFDHLDHIEFVIKVEDQFRIEIPDENLPALDSIDVLAMFIVEK